MPCQPPRCMPTLDQIAASAAEIRIKKHGRVGTCETCRREFRLPKGERMGSLCHECQAQLDELPPTVLLDTTNRQQQFLDRIATIEGYASLPANWDTYGGLPACEKVVTFAVGLLRELMRASGVPPPRVAPISTGVYMTWEGPTTRAYIEADVGAVLFVAEGHGRRVAEYEDHAYNVSRAAITIKRMGLDGRFSMAGSEKTRKRVPN